MSETVFEFDMVKIRCDIMWLQMCNFDLHFQAVAVGVDFSIISVICSFTISAINLYVDCYLSSVTTDQFLILIERLFEFDWYKLPVDEQRYFMLMIGNMQQPIAYDGFHVFSLNLATYSKVI